MIVTRTPFRITLGGGGTDLPSYYSEHGGFIFAVGIDKYMSIALNRSVIDENIHLKYSKYEVVRSVGELQHDIAREILRFTGVEGNMDINSTADLPAGTGLGSSSCYAVGLLHAIHTLQHKYTSLETIAEEDFKIEAGILKRPIGKQDPYLAAFGGLTVLDIKKDGKVDVRKANVSMEVADELNNNLLVFFTGMTRSADEILKEQTDSIVGKKKDVVESMHYIKELGYEILEAAEAGNIDEIGKKFDAHWQHKKKISDRITSPAFDKIYATAMRNGALGGKISGAGGGGFFTFYVPDRQRHFRETMKGLGLCEMRYRFDFEGSKVIVDF